MNTKIFLILISASVFVVDMVIKNSVMSSFFSQSGVFINKNFAWGIPIDNSIIIIAMSAIILFLLFFSIKRRNAVFSFLIAGAVSNLIDRIFYGGVIDYIDLPFGVVINLADVLVVSGVLLLII